MTSFQFIHHETYPLHKRKGSNRRTAVSILLESAREERSCSHIAQPSEPIILYGENPLDLIPQLEWIHANGKCKKNNNKIRKDAQILGASVASIELEPTAENLKKPEVIKWLKDAHEFFKEEFKDSYKSLVLHLWRK